MGTPSTSRYYQPLIFISLPKPSAILSHSICKSWHLWTCIFPLWVLVENLATRWQFTFRIGCVLEFSNTSIKPVTNPNLHFISQCPKKHFYWNWQLSVIKLFPGLCTSWGCLIEIDSPIRWNLHFPKSKNKLTEVYLTENPLLNYKKWDVNRANTIAWWLTAKMNDFMTKLEVD